MATTYKSHPEYKSTAALAEFLYDEDRTTYTADELGALNYRTRTPRHDLVRELASYGLQLEAREVPRHTRGFTTSSNDRWYGPGSSATHGGSGFSNFE